MLHNNVTNTKEKKLDKKHSKRETNKTRGNIDTKAMQTINYTNAKKKRNNSSTKIRDNN